MTIAEEILKAAKKQFPGSKIQVGQITGDNYGYRWTIGIHDGKSHYECLGGAESGEALLAKVPQLRRQWLAEHESELQRRLAEVEALKANLAGEVGSPETAPASDETHSHPCP